MKKIILFTIFSSLLIANSTTLEAPIGLKLLTGGKKEAPQPSGESLFTSPNVKHDKSMLNSYIQDSISIKNEEAQNDRIQYSPNNQYNTQATEISEQELELMKKAMRYQNLNSLQKKFFDKKRTGFENVLTIPYTKDKTQSIRTRFAMNTTLIFDSNIKSFVLGDIAGFKIYQIPNMPNAISITPNLIGIDTNLTIFTEDNKLHNFYIFSTDHKNTQNPNLIVYIQDEESVLLAQEKEELKKEKLKEYLVIKEGIAELKVKKNEIRHGFIQKAKKENQWLLAEEIFRDNKFTYFKYTKTKMQKVPTIFAVIDKQDTPVETRVIGDYIIAETINPKFTIYIGDSYVCVDYKETSNRDKQ